MRFINIIILSFLLTGCSTSSVLNAAFSSFRSLYDTRSSDSINYEYYRNLPFASILVTINRNKAVLVLESINGNIEKWTAADGTYLKIKNGKVIESDGLINDFRHITNDEAHLVIFTNPKTSFLKYNSSFKLVESESISLKENNKVLDLYHENFFVKEINFKGKNLYWMDEDGFTWKSKQIVSPRTSISIEVLKPY